MSDVASLEAEAREQAGKGAARALRRSGRIPAVIYGDKKDPLPISIDGHALKQELAQAGFYLRLYDIKVGGKTEQVLPRDVQRHPVTSVPLHVDFLRIRAGATVAVNVGVVFINEEESPGLKRGGVLNVVRYEVELVCPAAAIPESLGHAWSQVWQEEQRKKADRQLMRQECHKAKQRRQVQPQPTCLAHHVIQGQQHGQGSELESGIHPTEARELHLPGGEEEKHYQYECPLTAEDTAAVKVGNENRR